MTFATVGTAFAGAPSTAFSKKSATLGSAASWAASARLRPKSAM
mgnify:CR=1 FL=1